MSVKAAVTPEVLTWARESAGYTVYEIAKKLGRKKITPETIQTWENGAEQPTYAQLKDIARFYKRPIVVFYFPAPPKEETLGEKFRSLPDSYSQKLPTSMRFLIRKAMDKQLALYELYGDFLPNDIQNFRNKIVPSHNLNRHNQHETNAMAKQARNLIGITLEEQLAWGNNPDKAIKQWRNALEGIGICLSDVHFPIVYVNNGEIKQRQIFTMFHELGHIILGNGGINFRDNMENKLTEDYKRKEVFCNAFAGAFLVPDDSLTLYNNPDNATIERFAQKYNVSREVILRKYLDRGLVSSEFYNDKTKEKERPSRGSGGGSYYLNQKSYIGHKYLNLVFSQYYNQRIDEYQLADYLGVKVKSLATLESYLHRSESA